MIGLWNTFLNLLYPPKCPGCKKPVDEHGAWCSLCFASILSPRKINKQEHHLTFLDSCQVGCEYTGTLKRMIHDMKFRQQKRYALYLRWAIHQGIDAAGFSHMDYVIPVPLHAQRLQERGYNQVEAIFKKWAVEANLLWMPMLLERSRYTIPQWELTMAERKKNIKGAFMVTQREMVVNKHIVLVDDIITTGLTLEECAKVLKKAGAASVHGLAVASGAR